MRYFGGFTTEERDQRTFEFKEVVAALMSDSRSESSTGVAISSRTLVASTAQAWKASREVNEDEY